jgi:uncharacterized membrane protein
LADSLQRSANYERLRALQSQGLLDTSAVSRGVRLAAATPDSATWRRVIDVYLLGIGVALLLAGIVFFFAFNWADLHRFAKLGLVGACIIASAGYAAAVGLERLSGKSALAAATVLVGPLWAVFGQTYQTGADPWNLFAAWAALTLPWVVGARFALLWLVWIAIADTALVLFWEQALHQVKLDPWLALWVIHGGAWLASSWGRDRQIPWLDVPWARRLVACAALVCLVVPSAKLIFTGPDNWDIIAPMIFVSTCGWLYHRHAAPTRDLPILTAAAAGVIVLTSCALGRLIVDWGEIVVFFILTLAISGQVAGFAKWLRTLHREDLQPPATGEIS